MKEKMVALIGGTLIDGTGKDPAMNTTILTSGTIIQAVGQMDHAKLPEDCDIIDITGKTVMPGMMDLHVHLHLGEDDIIMPRGGLPPTLDQPLTLIGIKGFARARKTLKMGFTTLRCVGEAGYLDVALRDAVNSGLVEGPRIVTSGQFLTTTGGHADFMPLWLARTDDVTNVADGVDGVLKAVRRQIKMKTDWIKIFATGGLMDPEDKQEFNDDELKTIVDEAHGKEKFVCAHAMHAKGTLAAVRAGVDSIEHGFQLTDETIDLMLQNGTYLIPTIYAPYAVVHHGEKFGLSKDYCARMRPFLKSLEKSFPKALAAGVKIALGTDCGFNMLYHGTNAYELELLVKYGMTPMQAIMTATKSAASCLRMDDKLGTIDKGKAADLVVVDGKPLDDIKILQDKNKISLVMKEGAVHVNRL